MRNDNIWERLKVNIITEVQESKTDVVWTCEESETRPSLCWKTNTGDGVIWKKKMMTNTTAEMNGLCQTRHASYRDNRI